MMARYPQDEKDSKTKKSVFSKIISVIIAIVVILIAEHVYVNGQESTEVRKSALTYIIDLVEEVTGFDLTEIEGLITETSDVKNPDIENPDIESSNVEVPKKETSDNGARAYDDSKLEIYFFDVEQADSILILTDGKALLIDTGNAGDATTKNNLVEGNINLTYELNRLGVEFIDILVATHPHEDHMGSMYKIINVFGIGKMYANAFTAAEIDKNYYDRFIEAVEDKNVRWISPTTLTEEQLIAKVNEYNAAIEEAKEEAIEEGKEEEIDEKIVYDANDYIRVGDVIEFGDAILTVLAPNSAEYSDVNDYSIVLMLEFEGVKLMLTGDAGKESEEEILRYAAENGIDLDCDILKVGHHGSRTASTEEFISAVKPEYSIIMVEEGHKYGLPDEDVIERLRKYNSVIYQTTNEGDIRLVIDDGKYEFDFTYQHEEKPEND